MRQLRSHLRALALLAYAAVLLAGLSGHDLCIGSDGHMAIQPAYSRCCTACPDDAAAETPGALWVAASGGCGDCVDIPLSFGADDHHAPHGSRALSRLQAVDGTGMLSVSVTGDTPVAPSPGFLLPPARSVPRLSRRTDVLRI